MEDAVLYTCPTCQTPLIIKHWHLEDGVLVPETLPTDHDDLLDEIENLRDEIKTLKGALNDRLPH